MRLLLWVAEQVRQLRTTCIDVIIIDETSPVPKAMIKEAEQYAMESKEPKSQREKAKADGKEDEEQDITKKLQRCGPPTDSSFAALIEILISECEAKSTAADHIGQLQVVNNACELGPVLSARVCKLESCHEDSGNIKFVLCFFNDALTTRRAVLESLRALGGDVKEAVRLQDGSNPNWVSGSSQSTNSTATISLRFLQPFVPPR